MNTKDLPQQHNRKKEPPPIDWLKTQLSYDPETGELRRLVGGRGRRDKAGTQDERGYWYVCMCYGGGFHKLKSARLAFALMTNRWPMLVDHISGDKQDDRWRNLREVTPSGNEKNKPISAKSKTGVFGVTWYGDKASWRVRIKSDKIRYQLGYFKDFFEAICARKSAELRYGFHENHGRA